MPICIAPRGGYWSACFAGLIAGFYTVYRIIAPIVRSM